MQSKIKSFLIFFILTLLFSPVYSMALPADLAESNQVHWLFNHYLSKQKEPISDIVLSYIISKETNEVKNEEVVYKNILIPNPGQVPRVINPKSEYLDVSAGFEKVYFNSYNTNYKVDFSCSNAIKSYYSQKNEDLKKSSYIDLENINLDNINFVIEKIITPRTKSSLIAYLSENEVSNPEKCIADLEANRNIYSFPILFVLISKIKGTKDEVGNGFTFEVKFEPEFLTPIQTKKFKILFRKEPIQLNSIYTLPKGCEKPIVPGKCYITQKDIADFHLSKIESSDGVLVDDILHSHLNNFNVVSGFKEQSFEGINITQLLVDLSINRENFCFREGNDKYTDTIFRVAKAYNLSMEQAFQLWAIISERSNCNSDLNPDLYGFAQIDLKDRDSGNLINIEEVSYNKSPENIDPNCSKCGIDYFLSMNYPKKTVSVGGEKLKKREVCYKCVSSKKVQRCNPNNGIVGGITTLPAPLKEEICPDIDNAQTDSVSQITKISNNLPLQLAEEEQFQYLALGDFKEINKHLLNEVYNNDKNKFYNLGYKGEINNDNGYFGFLINAIKHNRKDSFGSVVLFTSDYLKELNFLVKNSREFSDNPYSFEDFVLDNENNVNMVYVFANLFNKDVVQQIYESGKFPKLFEETAFFVNDGANIKSTKEIRVLLNYLAIKRRFYRNPQYFLKYKLSTDFPESKSKTYEELDHRYWATKKDIYSYVPLNNKKLMLKKDLDLYNYDKLLQFSGKANFPVKYVLDFGQSAYLDGRWYFPNPGAHAWSFDTKQEALDNYTLVWEASDVCLGKTVCEENDFIGKNCCRENKEVQDGTRRYKYSDVLVDGAILGIYNPTSKYNDENREYTHLAIYIGKTTTGLPLIAESTASGQEINILTKEIKNRIKRIYLPKIINFKNIKEIINNSNKIPPAYIKLTENQIKEVNNIPKGTEYYEDPNVEGEGDIESLEISKHKCDIQKQETLERYIDCLLDNLTIVDIDKSYKINAQDYGKKISGNDIGRKLISNKYSTQDSLDCKDRKDFNEVIFKVVKRLKLSEEETAQLWSIIAAESGCKLNCGGNCYGNGIGQVVVSVWGNNQSYGNLKKTLLEINKNKYATASKYISVLKKQDKDPESATEISFAVYKFVVDYIISKSKKVDYPIVAETFRVYDNDYAINGMFAASYTYCTQYNLHFEKNKTQANYTGKYADHCRYTSFHKIGYYLAYKRMVYNCKIGKDTSNSFIETYKKEYGGKLCD